MVPGNDEGFLTTEEVLDYLQVNLRTVYRLIKAGKIPAVRVGTSVAFSEARHRRLAREPAATAGGASRSSSDHPDARRPSPRSRCRRRGQREGSAVEDTGARRVRRGRRARRPLRGGSAPRAPLRPPHHGSEDARSGRPLRDPRGTIGSRPTFPSSSLPASRPRRARLRRSTSGCPVTSPSHSGFRECSRSPQERWANNFFSIIEFLPI